MTARTLEAGVALVATIRPQLVIADGWLADASPFALVRCLVYTPHTRTIPVLICIAASAELATLPSADRNPVSIELPEPLQGITCCSTSPAVSPPRQRPATWWSGSAALSLSSCARTVP
jgi:hypothetical protein